VLQSPQDRDDLIPTLQIQTYFADRQTIQTFLWTGQTHGASSVKIGTKSSAFPRFFSFYRRFSLQSSMTLSLKISGKNQAISI
jgi:hypothetical protein